MYNVSIYSDLTLYNTCQENGRVQIISHHASYKMSLSWCFWEAHFSCLSNQSNVYGLTSFRLPDGGSKVLVAPLKDNVLCLEYVKEKGKLKPVAKEVQFIYSNPGTMDNPTFSNCLSFDWLNLSHTHQKLLNAKQTK